MKLPAEIITNILQYVKPKKLELIYDNIYELHPHISHINKSRYIKRYLGRLNYATPGNSWIMPMKYNLLDILENKWFLRILIYDDMYIELYNNIDRIKNKNIYIEIRHTDIPFDKPISKLSGIHSLSLYECSGINELSNIMNMTYLFIKKCDVTNVFNLQNIKYITIYSRLSNLYNVHNCKYINISNCTSILNNNRFTVKNIHNCNNLILYNLYNIYDISNINNIHINLLSTHILRDLTCFKDVENITFERLKSTFDYMPLQNCKSVQFLHSNNIGDVSPLYTVNKVIFKNTVGITGISKLSCVPNLLPP